jgi:hypothetical protein
MGGTPNDIEFSGERKQVRSNEGLDDRKAIVTQRPGPAHENSGKFPGRDEREECERNDELQDELPAPLP